MTTLAVSLDRADPRPLGAQLADQVRHQVTDGRLAPGDRLPSSRALAGELGVARAVTEQAYGQLVAEGWLEGRHGSGTFVAAGRPVARPAAARRTPRAPEADLVRLDAGTPWIDPRHAASWRRAWRDVAAARPPRGYDDPRGLPELRAELAARLGRIRGLDVDPDEVLVTAGTTDGLRHLLGDLPPGPVTVEDPGYRAAAATVRLAGREVRDLPALAPVTDLAGCAAAYVTPAHQHPLGPTMPGSARLGLLEAARRAGAVVVEDDYDSEFRYDVAPVPALASLDRDRVAYLGTASKSVAPSMRLGWLVPPPALLDAVERTRQVTHDTASWPVQRAFLSLLRDGYVDKVVRSARRVYADRAARVTGALAPLATLRGPVAGMYATVELDADAARRGQAAARAAGFDVPLLADYCRTHLRHGLIIGFGGCTDAELDAALVAITRGLAG
ncbi:MULTISPECIES: MocR-like pyridoxine biosynthesis transcription factor PdxR [unclassified Nocardioides]|uniref:MocR-like pyridoxine biosynthesis transcription factor PdxR n=1 Tax=unclassified Nocardioides TaxID=2615069 RepID=UPI0030141F8B